jgi:hypothetical protein
MGVFIEFLARHAQTAAFSLALTLFSSKTRQKANKMALYAVRGVALRSSEYFREENTRLRTERKWDCIISHRIAAGQACHVEAGRIDESPMFSHESRDPNRRDYATQALFGPRRSRVPLTEHLLGSAQS